MASRRGFGVRLDKPGVRPSGGKATDIETYVTEYLRDKLADAEETLSSGGGDTRLMQQRLSAMEAEVSAAIRLGAEVDMLRSQLRDKDEQISILRPGAGDASQELRGRLEQQQERVRGLEQENAIITRERELGISTVGGSVSQERYDQLVAENKRLALQIERGEADGGAGGLSSVDLMDLQGVKRDVKKMKQEKEELQRRYEEEVARRRELEEQGPLGGFAAENPGTMRELRDKIANLVIQNKQLSAAAEGSHQVMFDAQQKVEEKVIEMEDLRRDKDSEIAALEKNIQQAQQVRQKSCSMPPPPHRALLAATLRVPAFSEVFCSLTERRRLRVHRQDWGKEKNAIIWDQKEHHQALEANLTHERKSNVELQAMLE